MQASRSKRPHSPTKERENERNSSPSRDTRRRVPKRDHAERPAGDASPVHHKRRREENRDGEREGERRDRDETPHDNRPRYYQPSNPNIPKGKKSCDYQYI